MKKSMKILAILAIMMICMGVVANNVFAASNILTQIESATNSADVSAATDKVMPKVGQVIKMIRNFAVIAGVIIIIILGLKYMMGSVEEKSGYQKTFVPLIVGIILVMAATTIASFLFGIMD
jgi:type IV secretory pathway VirB2 component (pilin)